MGCAVTRGRRGSTATAAGRLHCRLCESGRLISVLDLGATPLSEKLLTIDELDLPEPTFPLHLRLCEDCLLLQIPALIDPGLLTMDRPDVVLALPWNLETELTDQLSYIADWGGQLVFPLPTLHHATSLASNDIGMVRS
jgi:hypothetical protein